MNDATVPQPVLFPDLCDRPLVATFDQAHASSDGGAILLKAADRALGLITALAQALPDPRGGQARDPRVARCARAADLRDHVRLPGCE